MVRQVGVERHAVAGRQRGLGAVHVQGHGAPLDDRGLARAGLVAGWVAGTTRAAPRRQRVPRDLGAQAGQRRGEHLVGMPPGAAAAAVAAAHDRDHALLGQAPELREPQVQPGGDLAGDLQRRARLPALDLRQHRRRHAGPLGELAQREVHRLPKRLHARPDGRDGAIDSRRHYACTLSRTPVAPSLGAVTEAIRSLPDALVLGAGGTLGEAWLRGVLGGLEAGAGLDFRACEYLLGTSAGSIVAATLASGKRPEAGEAAAQAWGHAAALPEPAGEPDAPARANPLAAVGRRAARLGKKVATPLAPLALATTAPAGRLARAAVLSRAPRPGRTLDDLRGHLDRLGAPFDGRLRVFAVDRASGKRVSFGAPDAPRATVSQAVLASCAVPWLFAPVEIDGREYVDGGVWSPTNLDAVPAGRGSRVLCLIPTAGAALATLRTASAAAAGYEGMALSARGATVRTIVPGAESLAAIGPNLMDPRRRAAVAAAGYAQGRRLT